MATTTIQTLLSQSRLLTQLITQFNTFRAVMEGPERIIWDQIVEESLALSAGLADLGQSTGAGRFPNTFAKNGAYMYVNNSDEETAALENGFRPATFPETMIKEGSPNLVVHNSVQKFEALQLGYTLPGLG